MIITITCLVLFNESSKIEDKIPKTSKNRFPAITQFIREDVKTLPIYSSSSNAKIINVVIQPKRIALMFTKIKADLLRYCLISSSIYNAGL